GCSSKPAPPSTKTGGLPLTGQSGRERGGLWGKWFAGVIHGLFQKDLHPSYPPKTKGHAFNQCLATGSWGATEMGKDREFLS
ncbi:hypothetical protein ABG768_007884, partial [Culter alburnus]